MADTREKLVELLKHDTCKGSTYEDCYDCEFDGMQDCFFVAQADHLIAHGVRLEEKQATSNASEQFASDNHVGGKWIPVTERLPGKMGQYVCRYVFGENMDYPFYQVLWYFANLEKPHFQHEGSMGLTVTHWAYLPEPPKGE